MKKTITVATACYDRDWRIILSEGYLAKIFARFNYNFDKKILIINTSTKNNEIKEAALREVSSGNIDEFYFTDDIKKEVMDFFSIKDFIYTDYFSLFKKGFDVSLAKRFYNFYFKKKGKSKIVSIRKKQYDCIDYSISPLCAIYKAQTDCLLYFTEDCAMNDNSGSEWVEKAFNLLDKEEYIAARPIDEDLDIRYFEEYDKDDEFYVSYLFTDRMFLSNVSDLKAIDYNCEDQHKYPPYGGAGFEARVYNYMAVNNMFMLISQNEKYIHEYDEYMNGIKPSNS